MQTEKYIIEWIFMESIKMFIQNESETQIKFLLIILFLVVDNQFLKEKSGSADH